MSARHFLVVDDHTLIVQGLRFLLKTKFPDSVVHTGTTADQARSLVALYGSATDLLILDLSLPDVEKPTELLEELVRQNPTLKILVLSGITDPEQVSQVLRLGAAGFVPKSLETDTLTKAVDLVLKGGVYVPMKLLSEAQKKKFIDNATLKDNAPDVRLTDRQKDVLLCLARFRSKAFAGNLIYRKEPSKHTSRQFIGPFMPITARKLSLPPKKPDTKSFFSAIAYP